MKKWYSFYASAGTSKKLQQLVGKIDRGNRIELNRNPVLPQPEEQQQADTELTLPTAFGYVPWGHHILIITRCKTVKEALFYIHKTIENNWSRNTLDNNIRAGLYRTAGGALTNFSDQLPDQQGKLAQEILKENYDLGFVSLPEDYNETALEDAIEHRMTRFLLELGEGWAFVGRQKGIVISGKTRKIDLLFYHIYLRCYVVIELKVTPFEPEFAGKLNYYVNAVNELIRREGDNPTIGLLICKSMDHTEVRLAFQGIMTPMGVSTYDNVRIKEIRDRLPTRAQIQHVIEQVEEEFRRNKQNERTIGE